MKSKERQSLSQLCNEMYDNPQEIIDENNRQKALHRDVNQQILDLLKSQGISDEEIENFTNFVKTQKLGSAGDYEGLDKYRHRGPNNP